MRYLALFSAFLVMVVLAMPAQAQWEPTQQTAGGDFVALGTIGNKVLAATIVGSLFYSSDNGSDWTAAGFYPQSYGAATPFLQNGAEIFIGSGNGIFASTDSGIHWASRNTGISNFAIVGLTRCRSTLFAASSRFNSNAGTFSSSLTSSTDAGENWVQASPGLNLQRPMTALGALDTNVFVLNDMLYRSSNFGRSWTPLQNMQLLWLASAENLLFASTDTDLQESSDNGGTWTILKHGLPAKASYYGLAVRDSLLFVATDTANSQKAVALVYLSTDKGSHWRNISEGLDSDRFISMAVNSSYLFGGDAHRVWRRSLDDILGIAAVGPMPISSSPEISQNQNRLRISAGGNFDFHILNLLGATVFSHEGIGTLDLDLSGLPAGVYFAIVASGGQREVRKIAVVH